MCGGGSLSRTVWDLRGLEHAVAVYLVERLADYLEDTSGFRHWLKKRWRLDLPVSELSPLTEVFGGECSLAAVLSDLMRVLFRVRCYPSDARAWRTVGDMISWLAGRLEAVEGQPFDLEEETGDDVEDDLVRQVMQAFAALPVRWGPRGVVRAHEITPSLPCWCGSGAPYLRCCGVGFVPKPGWRSYVRRYW